MQKNTNKYILSITDHTRAVPTSVVLYCSKVSSFYTMCPPDSCNPPLKCCTSPSLLLVTAVLRVGEEQLVEGGTLTFQFMEKYHLVVRMSSWSFTVMQNRSQVKRMVCSWSAHCESSTLHFSEKVKDDLQSILKYYTCYHNDRFCKISKYPLMSKTLNGDV